MERHGVVALLWILPLAKILVAVTCLCFAGKRAFGAGVIVSLAVGALIFFGTCASNFRI